VRERVVTTGGDHERRQTIHLLERVEELLQGLEKAGIAEYVRFLDNPRRVVYVNMIGGLARGFGVAVGFTLVAAILILILGRLARLNLPVIGQFIAELARIVENELKFGR
jgi:hypothetical protein